MIRRETGICKTSMYGHYNAYAVYKLKNGKYKIFKYTFTDSMFYDKWNSDDWNLKRREKEALKKARLDPQPSILDDRPDWHYLARPFR